MLISEKITMFIAAWMVFILIIAIDVKFEIFFILIFIGFLTVKVFAGRFTITRMKNRMNIFIFVFLIVFMIIIVKKIISFLSI